MAKVKVSLHEEFRKVVTVGHDAIESAMDDALRAGSAAAHTSMETQATARAYEDLNAQMAEERKGMKGAFYTDTAISEKWGLDPWYLRFFEYGTQYIEAMPFMRPGAKVMKKTFDTVMRTRFEKTIAARVRVR